MFLISDIWIHFFVVKGIETSSKNNDYTSIEFQNEKFDSEMGESIII